jgi:hypothetical protein
MYKKRPLNFKPPRGFEDMEIIVKDSLVRLDEVQDYYTDFFASALEVWHTFHVGMGLPFLGGWAEQPWHLYQVIYLFESESKSIENKIAEDARKKR